MGASTGAETGTSPLILDRTDHHHREDIVVMLAIFLAILASELNAAAAHSSSIKTIHMVLLSILHFVVAITQV